MSPATLIILGFVIGSNNLAAALALGVLGQADRRWRVIGVFGAFEFVIPLVGMWLGRQVSAWIVGHAHWVGPALLAALGISSILAARRQRPVDEETADRATTWTGLICLAFGMSVDNLVVGFSLGLRDTRPLTVAATIAGFSMAFTWFGMIAGKKARHRWQRRAEAGSGLLLLALALATWMDWL